jgi:hypothetical protein
MMERVRFCIFVALLTQLLPACKGTRSSREGSPATPSATPSPSVPAPVIEPPVPSDELTVPTAWPIPSGPRLGIFAGEGVGAIRFGANVTTIERLMEAPCEIKTDDACRYIALAVEFMLKDGVVSEIRTHRPNRPTTPKPRVFGIFNGHTPEEVAFTMLRPAAKGLLGPPEKTEPVADGGDAHTVEVDTYNGLRVEYDQLPNGNVVVGGMVVVKPTKPMKPMKAPKQSGPKPAAAKK